MIESLDPIAEVLDLFEPSFPEEPGGWEDVLRRAQQPLATPAVRPYVYANDGARRVPRITRPRLMLSAAAVPVFAVVIALAVLSWPFSSGPDVLSRALAAIGAGPVVHVVLEQQGAQLVDLRTGARTSASGRTEIWYEPGHGLRIESSFRGVPGTTLAQTFAPNSQGVTPANSAAAQFFAGYQTFVAGYRAELKAHAYHVVGSATLNGRPIYWIAAEPQEAFTQMGYRSVVSEVAIDKTTYKPVLLRSITDGRIEPGSIERVLDAETSQPKPGLFHTSVPFHYGGAALNAPPLTLDQAERMRPRPLLPASIGGIARAWIGKTPYYYDGGGAVAAGPGCNGPRTQTPAVKHGVAPGRLCAPEIPSGPNIPGVSVFYGTLQLGDPAYQSPPAISIVEMPTNNPLIQWLGTGYFPANDKAIISRDIENTITLKTHGLYITITASSPTLALDAAKIINR